MSVDKEKLAAVAPQLEAGIVKNGSRPYSVTYPELTQAVRDAELFGPNYMFILAAMFPIRYMFNGLKDFSYMELNAKKEAYGPNDDVTDVSQLNSVKNIIGKETFKAIIQNNYSQIVMDQELINFMTNPTDAIARALKTIEAINMKQDLAREETMWDLVEPNATKVNIHGLPIVSTDGKNSVTKLVYNRVKKLETTSKTHPEIGDNGVITIVNYDPNTGAEIKKVKVQPLRFFMPSDFHAIFSVDYATSVVYDGLKAFFNWTGGDMQFASTRTLDVEHYAGMSETARAALQKAKVILIATNKFQNIGDWDISEIFKADRAWTKFTRYLKYGVYVRKDAPMFVFEDIEPDAKQLKAEADAKEQAKEIAEAKRIEQLRADAVIKAEAELEVQSKHNKGN